MQSSRTSAQIKAAQRDDREESIFAIGSVLGPRFVASSLPLTATLSQHLREESAVVNPPLKLAFNRPRPFVADATVIPVCARAATNSYPSGHTMVGYLEAFALTQMLPEKTDLILQRAHEYAHNRVICGVHYPSDLEASRIIAAALFGALAVSPRFKEELAAAKAEVRKQLALQP